MKLAALAAALAVALSASAAGGVSIAILTHLDGSYAYGKETLRGIALRLLKGLSRR